MTREPEQVRAFRDTWRDGIHSYLSYLRDRLTLAREMLADSGSLFVQIGDENAHRVRTVMDEVFGEGNFVSQIAFATTSGRGSNFLDSVFDTLLWYAKDKDRLKFRPIFAVRNDTENDSFYRFVDELFGQNGKLFRKSGFTSQGQTDGDTSEPFDWRGATYRPERGRHWSTRKLGLQRADRADRVVHSGNNIAYKRFVDDRPVVPIQNIWNDTGGFALVGSKIYVVQTNTRVIERCILMTTDPGDLVLDPTCGSGTSAFVAEEWGRRWITVDTSRVALALARSRIMGSRYPFYLLADSEDGKEKEAEIARTVPSSSPTYCDIRQGFVNARVPHITLRDIANNAEIDVIWDDFQTRMEPVSARLNNQLGTSWEEWEIPRESEAGWSEAVKQIHAEWWKLRIARQEEIDASIAAKAEFEYLFDKPYEDRSKVRVAGPFTVESVTPHRILSVDENGEFFDGFEDEGEEFGSVDDFAQRMLEHLKTAGIQQAHKEDKIDFDSVVGFPGRLICAEGQYMEGDENNGRRRRAGIYIGPEFGTVSRVDLVEAAREASEIGF